MCNGVTQTAPCGPTYLPTPQPTENPTIGPVPVPTSAVSVDNLTRQSRRRRSDARAPVARLKRLFLQVRADGRAHALAERGAHLEAQLHPDFCALGAAELAALVKADVRTDAEPDAKPLCQADRVERAPLNIVCLVSPPYPPHPPLP